MGVKKITGAETSLLIPLIIKAREYDHPESILKDPYAKSVARHFQLDLSNYKINRIYATALLFRAKQYDNYVREYMRIHPDGLIVEIGPGLDSRFYRVDNGKIRWINLDLPNVKRLRKEFFKPNKRIEDIDIALEKMEWSKVYKKYHTPLFIAEGVLSNLDKNLVSDLLRKLGQIFRGSVICFDMIHVPGDQQGVSKKWRNAKIESIVNQENGCILIEEWRCYDTFHRRYGFANLYRFVPAVNNSFKIIQAQFI